MVSVDFRSMHLIMILKKSNRGNANNLKIDALLNTLNSSHLAHEDISAKIVSLS